MANVFSKNSFSSPLLLSASEGVFMSAVFLAECPHLSAADDRFAEKGKKRFFFVLGERWERSWRHTLFRNELPSFKKGISFSCSPYFESLAFLENKELILLLDGVGKFSVLSVDSFKKLFLTKKFLLHKSRATNCCPTNLQPGYLPLSLQNSLFFICPYYYRWERKWGGARTQRKKNYNCHVKEGAPRIFFVRILPKIVFRRRTLDRTGGLGLDFLGEGPFVRAEWRWLESEMPLLSQTDSFKNRNAAIF